MAPDSIPASADSDKYLDEALDSTHVLVAIVGPKWEALLQEKLQSGEQDWVRREIRFALDNDLIVAPVCIKRNCIPLNDSVPSDIQPMLTPQFSFIHADANFHREVDKLVSDIETNLNKRGIQIDDSSSIDHVLGLSLSELSEHVFGLLKPDNRLDLDKLLREFPERYLDRISSSDESKQNAITAGMNSTVVVGIELIIYGNLDIFQKYLRSLHRVFDLADRRFSAQVSPSTQTARIRYELLKKLYILGAMLLHEDKLDWIESLVRYRVGTLPGREKSELWIRSMQLNQPVPQEKNLALLPSITQEATSLTDEYVLKQFSHDEQALIERVYQFDYLVCLYVAIDMNRPGGFPYFGITDLDLISSMLERLIADRNARSDLFETELTDELLAVSTATYIERARDRYACRFGGFWNNSPSSTIVSFLRHHLPKQMNERWTLFM